MMVDVGVLPGFVLVILLFLVPPGPDMAYMIAVGLGQGRSAALKAILGIGTGMSIYAVTVVIGVGRAAQTNPALLDAVKVFGALYLAWLAYTTVRSVRGAPAGEQSASAGQPYLRGLTVSLANPKVMLFFVAVLPQFIGDARAAELQHAMLGAVNVLTEVLLYGAIGALAGVLHARHAGSSRARGALSYVAAAVYTALAVTVVAEVATQSI